jgi:aryl-alcohol dehydrogenase-like predicted oxidoreductase
VWVVKVPDMKLCLGTVQFGMKYGISNKTGKVKYEEVEKILDFCNEKGICTIDTANAYGESESILGNFDLNDYNIITKITCSDQIEKSLEKLKLSSLYGILIHNENLVGDNWSKLLYYKSKGIVKKIGVSVYSPDKLLSIIDNYSIDIVQLPLNILDQRFLFLLKRIKKAKIEIHARSIFLQGLLLMNYSQIPDYFSQIKPILSKIPKDKLGFTLNFVKNIDEIDRIVIGVTSKKELEGIYTAYQKKTFDYSEYSINDENMINPSFWRYS